MLESIHIKGFKSVREARLPLSDLTLLIGANASGKSNVLEAMQLLSWLAGGGRLSQIQLAIQSGALRLRGASTDMVGTMLGGAGADARVGLGCRLIGVRPRDLLELELELQVKAERLRIVGEQLDAPRMRTRVPLYRVSEAASEYGSQLTIEYNNFKRGQRKPQIPGADDQPVFTQLTTPARFASDHKDSQRIIPDAARRVQEALSRVLFLDPSPGAMRSYSFRTERQLAGDGQNLSAVLHDLTEERGQKDDVLRFVRDLPEQEVADIRYVETPRNEVMVQLVESFGGRRTPVDAALLSDGTLRVLAVAAALLSIPEGSAVVIEELDNGVHPSRARSLLRGIRAVAARRRLRVLLTTHNPALLDALPPDVVPHVVACFRDPADGYTRLERLEDVATYPALIASGALGDLVTDGVLDRHVKASDAPAASGEAARAWLEGLLSGTDG